MLNQTGIPTKEQVKSVFPEKSALIRPKAILECYEDIPCNPCSTSCPFDAIDIGPNINKQPKLNVDLCTGCGVCVPSCPGLAIVIAQVKEDLVIFKIPYEFLPKPVKNEIWHGVNRSGEIICEAKIENTVMNKTTDHTAVVTVSVPVQFLYDFVTIRAKHE
jgi:Na+-translocating ferredoxin:NAD+ oxidoreductase RNF subunit RnfB